jgi:hypothetical protein
MNSLLRAQKRRHCEERSDAAIFKPLILNCQIATLAVPGMAQASLSTGSLSHLLHVHRARKDEVI